MYVKSLVAAAFALLVSTVKASGVVFTNLEGSSQTAGTPMDITWLFQPNEQTFPGNSATDVISFQLVDVRNGPTFGVTIGTGPFATAPIGGNKATGIVPSVVDGNDYALAATCNGKTVYSPKFAIKAGTGAPATSGAASAPTATATTAGGPPATTPASKPTTPVVAPGPVAPAPVVPAPAGSATSSAAAAATEAAKNSASGNLPALAALAAIPMAAVFLA
ncbi:hypothetical protein DFJ77DRAFT_455055 [Powellomyces hirtus]|nr:hypothetical protein DFJ77DRAFT_455055 [Powellomyces hirtus]